MLLCFILTVPTVISNTFNFVVKHLYPARTMHFKHRKRDAGDINLINFCTTLYPSSVIFTRVFCVPIIVNCKCCLLTRRCLPFFHQGPFDSPDSQELSLTSQTLLKNLPLRYSLVGGLERIECLSVVAQGMVGDGETITLHYLDCLLK